jgi:hypothetical protein
MLGTVAARAVIRMIEKVKMDNPDRNNGSTSASGNTSMTAVLHRLTAVLTHENEILESTNDADHANYIIAKNQALRELIVMHRAQQQTAYTPELLQHLHEFRKLIDRNSQLLNLQVSTLNDLASILAKSAR